MSTPIRKAMVLCAGLGTRLHPITHKIPKPIVEVLNIPNLFHILHLLKRVGVTEVIVNLFHLTDRMESFISNQSNLGINFHFSKEGPLLGTGGGVKRAEAFLKDNDFILANCDFVTDLNLNPIIESHLSNKSMATMVLIQDERRQRLYSRVGMDENNILCSLPKLETKRPTQSGIFTGIHILNPSILSMLEDRPSGINDTLYPHLMKEKPAAARGYLERSAFWYDTGDIDAIWYASMELLRLVLNGNSLFKELNQSFQMNYHEIKKGIWLEDGAKLPSNLNLIPPVVIAKDSTFGTSISLGPYAIIGRGCSLANGASITTSVLLQGAEVSADTPIANSLCFEGTVLLAKPIV